MVLSNVGSISKGTLLYLLFQPLCFLQQPLLRGQQGGQWLQGHSWQDCGCWHHLRARLQDPVPCSSVGGVRFVGISPLPLHDRVHGIPCSNTGTGLLKSWCLVRRLLGVQIGCSIRRPMLTSGIKSTSGFASSRFKPIEVPIAIIKASTLWEPVCRVVNNLSQP